MQLLTDSQSSNEKSKNDNLRKWMVFDVEAVGLYGESWAFGYIILDHYGDKLDEGLVATDWRKLPGRPSDHEWLRQNIPPIPFDAASPEEVRSAFWKVYTSDPSLVLVADVSFPVETNFLQKAVVENNGYERSPYPLIDISSILLARFKDPVGYFPRIEEEIPAHNPLHDARQSGRIFIANHLSVVNSLIASHEEATEVLRKQKTSWFERILGK